MSQIQGSKLGISIAAMTASFMAILDISIVNVALTDIRASFGTPLDQIAWVSTGYMMANVVVIPMTGWLQRRFGFRNYFTASILLFVLASTLCGFAWDLPSLVFFRILQGMGGGAIMPTAQSILFARYPKEEASMAGALFGIGAMTGPLLGPTVGGFLIDIANWHWIFLINIPVGGFAAYMTYKHIREPEFVKPHEPIDRYGIALLAVGMASLQYVLEEGHRHDWLESGTIAVLAALAISALITFVVHELEVKNPVVDFSVFKNRSYAAATGVNFLIGVALFSGAILFSLYCGAIMHYKASDVGMLFLKGSAIQLLLFPILGRTAHKFDGRYLVALGVALVSLSLWSNGFLSSMSSQSDLIKPVFLRAVGLCFIFVPLSVIALADMPQEKRGSATALFNLTRELGGSVGTALISSRLSSRAFEGYSRLTENVSQLSYVTQQQYGAAKAYVGARLLDADAGALSLLKLRISQQALIRAFNNNFATVAVIFSCSLLLLTLFKKPTPGVTVDGGH